MGIDISGGMIVGAHGSEIDVPEDYKGNLWEWLGEFVEWAIREVWQEVDNC